MHVCNECGDFHFQTMEKIFKFIVGITTSFEVLFVVRAFVRAVIGNTGMKRFGIARSRRRVFGRCLRVMLSHETFHVAFGITDTSGEFRGLSTSGM